eukprot:EG_transcript_3289
MAQPRAASGPGGPDVSGLVLADVAARCTPEAPFTDPTFPPTNESLGAVAHLIEENPHFRHLARKEVQWRRVADMCRAAGITDVFPMAVKPTDVKQGVCPDCFCITAVCALAAHPARLERLFLTKGLAANGVYCLQFFHRGRWTPVVIDDWVPCSPKNPNKPLFARSRTNHPWPVLIEKAYAKLYGSFAAIVGGNTAEALFDLTGAPVEDVNLSGVEAKAELAAGTFWPRLKELQASGAVLTAGTSKASGRMHIQREDGLVSGHAYHVLRVLPLVARPATTLLHLQNPWGRCSWNGDWAADSPLWTPAVRRAVGAESMGAGEFYISDRDFLKHFQSINAALLLPPDLATDAVADVVFDHDTAGGCNNFYTWRHNPIFLLQTSAAETEAFLTLQQAEQRGQAETIDYHPIGLTVLTVPELGPTMLTGGAPYEVIRKTSFWNKREISLQVSLPGRPDPYLVIPSSFFPGVEMACRLFIRSSAPLAVARHTPELAHICRLDGRWTKQSGSYKTVATNPQYTLAVEKDCVVHVLLWQEPPPGPPRESGNSISERPIGCVCYRGVRRCTKQPDPATKVGDLTFTKYTEVARTLALVAAEGPYCLVPCTYVSGVTGRFTLTVCSDTPFQLSPAEDARGTPAAAREPAAPTEATPPAPAPSAASSRPPKPKRSAKTPASPSDARSSPAVPSAAVTPIPRATLAKNRPGPAKPAAKGAPTNASPGDSTVLRVARVKTKTVASLYAGLE